ncbi:MAG: DMT family transporter [Alphaproteobacteria bacterium]|nr:DMT family transporter [Alphaproteobacteria bacterium]
MSSETTRRDNVPLGVGTILATVFALSFGDALIKAVGAGASFGIWQLFAVRSLLALPVLLGAALLMFGAGALRPQSLFWIGIRSALLVAMWIAYYVSLPLLPLPVAAAAYYTLPLFIVVFAALFGGETVGPVQWLAVAIGFLGVLTILRPGGDSFQAAALLPILAAMLYAVAMILTRTHCRNEHPVTLALGLNAMFISIGVAGLGYGAMRPEAMTGFLDAEFVPMAFEEWRSLVILAALLIVASVGTAIAYQAAPASTVGTFDFAYVAFALIWGLVIFDEHPDALGLLGIGLIVGAGVIAVRRRR